MKKEPTSTVQELEKLWWWRDQGSWATIAGKFDVGPSVVRQNFERTAYNYEMSARAIEWEKAPQWALGKSFIELDAEQIWETHRTFPHRIGTHGGLSPRGNLALDSRIFPEGLALFEQLVEKVKCRKYSAIEIDLAASKVGKIVEKKQIKETRVDSRAIQFVPILLAGKKKKMVTVRKMVIIPADPDDPKSKETIVEREFFDGWKPVPTISLEDWVIDPSITSKVECLKAISRELDALMLWHKLKWGSPNQNTPGKKAKALWEDPEKLDLIDHGLCTDKRRAIEKHLKARLRFAKGRV